MSISSATVSEILPTMPGTPWEPSTPAAPTDGGVDSVNPLLNSDGTCAIDPEWAEPRGFGISGGAGAVLASDGSGGRQTRLVHERIATRRVVLTWTQASGVDVELVRRAIQVTRSGAGTTRFRHPMLDPPGDVASAPLIRFPPQVVKVTRSADGAVAGMSVEVEYVE
jgi:hypothetical protein